MRHPTLWPQSWGAAKQEASVSSERGTLSLPKATAAAARAWGGTKCQGGGAELGLLQFPHLPFHLLSLPISSWTRAGRRGSLSGMCLSGWPLPAPSPPLSWWSWSLGVEEKERGQM